MEKVKHANLSDEKTSHNPPQTITLSIHGQGNSRFKSAEQSKTNQKSIHQTTDHQNLLKLNDGTTHNVDQTSFQQSNIGTLTLSMNRNTNVQQHTNHGLIQQKPQQLQTQVELQGDSEVQSILGTLKMRIQKQDKALLGQIVSQEEQVNTGNAITVNNQIIPKVASNNESTHLYNKQLAQVQKAPDPMKSKKSSFFSCGNCCRNKKKQKNEEQLNLNNDIPNPIQEQTLEKQNISNLQNTVSQQPQIQYNKAAGTFIKDQKYMNKDELKKFNEEQSLKQLEQSQEKKVISLEKDSISSIFHNIYTNKVISINLYDSDKNPSDFNNLIIDSKISDIQKRIDKLQLDVKERQIQLRQLFQDTEKNDFKVCNVNVITLVVQQNNLDIGNISDIKEIISRIGKYCEKECLRNIFDHQILSDIYKRQMNINKFLYSIEVLIILNFKDEQTITELVQHVQSLQRQIKISISGPNSGSSLPLGKEDHSEGIAMNPNMSNNTFQHVNSDPHKQIENEEDFIETVQENIVHKEIKKISVKPLIKLSNTSNQQALIPRNIEKQ
eukprot:403342518